MSKVEKESNTSPLEDVSDKFYPHIDEDLMLKFATQVSQSVGKIYDKPYIVKYIGVQGLTLEVDKNVKELAKKVTELCTEYEPLGCFGAPSKYNLYVHKGEEPKSLYLFYMAFSPEDANKIDNRNT